MGHERGRPVHGTLTSADVTTAAEVPFYEAGVATSGGATAVTLASDEHLVITDILAVTAVATALHVFLNDDDDGTADTGETVIRGTLAANGGIAKSFVETHRTGAPGAKLYVGAGDAGQVDVNFTGYVVGG
jgi:hypothetical protein